MANFLIAYKLTAGIEAGWTVDNGGQTYKGISRKGWPKWEGWQRIDAIIRKSGRPKQNQYFKDPFLDSMILSFYKKNYWDKIEGDLVESQDIANIIYDFYVNSGSALFIVNRALGARETNSINEDSLKIINSRPGFAYSAIREGRINHYLKLATKPKMAKYKDGWLARLDKFPLQLAA